MAENAQDRHQAALEKVGDMFALPTEEPAEEAEIEAGPVDAEEPADEVEEVEAAEDDATEEESAEAYAEIEIDGEVLEVPERYKDYFLRQSDYTRKTQELADQRKTVEVRMAEIDQRANDYQFIESVQDEINQANVLDWQMNEVKNQLRSNLDKMDQSTVLQTQMYLEQLKEQREAINQSVQKKYADHQQAREQFVQELLKKSTEVLRQQIPEWGEAAQKSLREYAVNNGFTEQELNNVHDPRMVVTLWKAKQYDALKKGSKEAVRKVEAAPKIRSKSRNPMPKSTQDKLNLRKKLKAQNVSDKDKGRAAGDYLARRFNM